MNEEEWIEKAKDYYLSRSEGGMTEEQAYRSAVATYEYSKEVGELGNGPECCVDEDIYCGEA